MIKWAKCFQFDRKRVQEWCKQKDDLMATGRSAKRQEDPEEDNADVEIVSNVEEPKLDFIQLSEDSDGDEELSDSIHNYAAKPIASYIYL